jgi:hypothetical protein
MIRVNKSCFLLFGVASSISLAIDAVAQNNALVNQIEQQVESLKTQLPTESQDADFQIQQAEFDRLRQQLLETEQSILDGSNTPAIQPGFVADNESGKSPQEEFIETAASESLQDSIPKESFENVKAEIREENIQPIPAKKEFINPESVKVKTLQKELQETRNKLLIAETELERLSAMISSQTQNRETTPTANDQSAVIFSTAKARAKSGNPDATIVTVVTDTASLRTGPSINSTKIMDVDNGQRLAVDDRQGDWFRVSTTSGMRAWVAVGDVAFGPSESSSPSSTIKIKPVSSAQSEEDDRAFALIKNRTATN